MLLQILQLLQLISLCFGAAIPNAEEKGEAHLQVKRQTDTLEWTVGPFSACSLTCGGGVRVRSVRCLNRDGIITPEGCAGNMPASYEFCNQIDCTTNIPDASLIPDDGLFFFEDNERARLQFTNTAPGSYTVELTTTESDNTTTTLTEMVTPLTIETQVTITGAPTERRIVDDMGTTTFAVNGDNVLQLNDARSTMVTDPTSVNFQNNEVIITNGENPEVFGTNITRFYYFDGFRLYRFDGDLMDPIVTNGTVYVSPNGRTGFLSTDTILNDQLNQIIADLEEVTTSPPDPPTTTEPPPTSTDPPPTSTDAPPTSTDSPPTSTMAPSTATPETDDPGTTSTMSPPPTSTQGTDDPDTEEPTSPASTAATPSTGDTTSPGETPSTSVATPTSTVATSTPSVATPSEPTDEPEDPEDPDIIDCEIEEEEEEEEEEETTRSSTTKRKSKSKGTHKSKKSKSKRKSKKGRYYENEEESESSESESSSSTSRSRGRGKRSGKRGKYTKCRVVAAVEEDSTTSRSSSSTTSRSGSTTSRSGSSTSRSGSSTSRSTSGSSSTSNTQVGVADVSSSPGQVQQNPARQAPQQEHSKDKTGGAARRYKPRPALSNWMMKMMKKLYGK